MFSRKTIFLFFAGCIMCAGCTEMPVFGLHRPAETREILGDYEVASELKVTPGKWSLTGVVNEPVVELVITGVGKKADGEYLLTYSFDGGEEKTQPIFYNEVQPQSYVLEIPDYLKTKNFCPAVAENQFYTHSVSILLENVYEPAVVPVRVTKEVPILSCPETERLHISFRDMKERPLNDFELIPDLAISDEGYILMELNWSPDDAIVGLETSDLSQDFNFFIQENRYGTGNTGYRNTRIYKVTPRRINDCLFNVTVTDGYIHQTISKEIKVTGQNTCQISYTEKNGAGKIFISFTKDVKATVTGTCNFYENFLVQQEAKSSLPAEPVVFEAGLTYELFNIFLDSEKTYTFDITLSVNAENGLDTKATVVSSGRHTFNVKMD